MRSTAGGFARRIAFGFVLLLAARPAVAADATMVAGELVALFTGDGRGATYRQAIAVGEVVTISGFAFADVLTGTRGEVAEIVVTNPVPQEAGGFIAESILLTAGTIGDAINTLRFDRVELLDMVVPPIVDVVDADAPLPLTGAVADGLTYERAGLANPLVIAHAELSAVKVGVDVPYALTASVSGVRLPLDFFDGLGLTEVIRSLGFESLALDMTFVGAFDSKNDTVIIDALALDIADFGHFDVAGIFTGLALRRIQEPGGAADVLAAAMVNSARIRFVNGGAMERFLQTQATLTNLQPQDVAFGLAAAFQIFLRILENPTLERQVGRAVGAFLRDPRSITFVATPAVPALVMEIVGLLLSAPTVLPAFLGIVVTAND